MTKPLRTPTTLLLSTALVQFMIVCSEMKTTVRMFLFLSLCGLNSGQTRNHFYVKEAKNWEAAKDHCTKHHDDLSTISAEEAQRLINNPDAATEFSWVGLYANPSNPNEWIWSGGEKEPTDIWFPGEPNYLDLQHCASLANSVPQLFNDLCSQKKSFYCMEYTFEQTVLHEDKTWAEALDYCRQNDLDLVSITSKAYMDKLINYSKTVNAGYVWTGLRFLAGQWFWVSGEDFKYKAWSQDTELTCPTNLRCAALDVENKVLIPKNCEERLKFFCLKKSF